MKALLPYLIKCPAEFLMSIFFIAYLCVGEPWSENTESWPPPTKDAAMVIALQFTMTVRIILSKFFSSKYGIIASLLIGFAVTILFCLHPIVNYSLVFFSYLFCVIFCIFTFQGNWEERIFKILFLVFLTTVFVFVIHFIVDVVLEIQYECLGPEDALISDAYALVGGTIVFVLCRDAVDDSIRFESEDSKREK